MSTQRAVSSTRPPFTSGRLIATLIVGAALGVAGSTLLRSGLSEELVVTLQSTAPAGSHTAFIAERPCASGRKCQLLFLGQVEKGKELETLKPPSSAAEIAWTPDGKRVGFVIDGRELALYDTATSKLAGRVGLLTNEAAQTRLVRGVTFSDNGRAVTFDECPKRQSGCRAGFVGIPQ